MTRNQTLLFALFAALYLILQELPAVPLLWLWKVTPIAILFFAVWRQPAFTGKRLLLAAVLFSAGGDLLLAFGFFVYGLASFLVAQLNYAGHFARHWASPRQRWPLSLALVVYVLLMASVLTPHLGELRIPVFAYLIVIFFMGLMALQSRLPLMPAIGALVFISSDSLIALNKFLHPIPFSSLLIMLTYYLAQWLLIHGCLISGRTDGQRQQHTDGRQR